MRKIFQRAGTTATGLTYAVWRRGKLSQSKKLKEVTAEQKTPGSEF
jgi:hypothetical protein